jgi:hypothetical protein
MLVEVDRVRFNLQSSMFYANRKKKEYQIDHRLTLLFFVPCMESRIKTKFGIWLGLSAVRVRVAIGESAGGTGGVQILLF